MNKFKFFSFCAVACLLAGLIFSAPVWAAGEDFAVKNHNITGQNVIAPGTSFELRLTLDQLGDGAHKSLVDSRPNDVKFYIDESACSFYLTNGGETAKLPGMQWFGNNLGGETVIPLTYDGASRNTIPIRAKLAHSGEELGVKNSQIKVNVASAPARDENPPARDEQNSPYLRLKPKATPSGQAGERLYLSLTVENIGWENAKNVQIQPVFEDNGVFKPDGVNVIQDLGDIEYNKSRNVSFSFLIDPTAETKVYTMKFAFVYMDPGGKIYGRTSPVTDSLYISVTGAKKTGGGFVLKNMAFSPGGGGTTVSFNINNTGSSEARNLTLTLLDLSPDKLSLIGETNVRKLGNLAGGGAVPVTFVLKQASALESGNYPVTIKLNYEDASGAAREETQQFFVPVTGKSSTKGVPKIILSSYSVNPVIAGAGENFDLNMTFQNTSAAKAVRNIKIFLTTPPSESDNNNSSNSAGKGNVFSPVGSSNSFFIDSISPKGTSAKTLRFFTVPDASPRTYTLKANIQYEDEAGTEYTSEELIGIPVSQKVKVEVGELTLPTDAKAGAPVNVTTNIYNTGRANISNLMLNLEGNFQTDNARLYIGNLNTGASEAYEGALIVEQAGQAEGELVVTYDAPSGEQVADRYPFSFTVSEAEPDLSALPATPPSRPLWRNPFFWGVIAVIAVVLFFLLRKKGPLRKLIRRGKENDVNEMD
ncbi:MAG: hypothetical protein LBH21_02655 [Gracilibacteraceae bacterium]|jgi:hypothetical protein|nr:hypothetical protein [Gracilibacteraceae bacterium]